MLRPNQIVSQRQNKVIWIGATLATLLEYGRGVVKSLPLLVKVGERKIRIILRRREVDRHLQVALRFVLVSQARVAEPRYPSGRRFHLGIQSRLFFDSFRVVDSVVIGPHRVFQDSQGHNRCVVDCAGLLGAQRLCQSQIERLVFRQKTGEAGVQLRIAWKTRSRRAQRLLQLCDIVHCDIHANEHR